MRVYDPPTIPRGLIGSSGNTHKPYRLLIAFVFILANGLLLDDLSRFGVVVIARGEPTGAPAAVDVLHHVGVEQLASRTCRRRQLDDRWITVGEQPQLLDHVRVNGKPVALPELEVVTKHPSQHFEEGSAHVHGALLELDVANPPHLVDRAEENLDVLTHDGVGDLLTDLLKSGNQLADDDAPARSQVGVKPTDDLEHGRGSDQLLPLLALLPGDPPGEHECPPVVAEPVNQLHKGVVVPPVTEDDVRRELGPLHVEDPEALALPFLGRTDVDHRPYTGLNRVIAGELELARFNPLLAIDDVDRVVEHDVSGFDLAVVITAHAELDVGNCPNVERLDKLHDGRERCHLPLVFSHLESQEGGWLDDSAQDDLTLLGLVQRGVDNTNRHGSVPLSAATL